MNGGKSTVNKPIRLLLVSNKYDCEYSYATLRAAQMSEGLKDSVIPAKICC